MKKLTFLIISSLLLLSCNNEDDKIQYPECVQSIITTYTKNNPIPSKEYGRAHVDKYYYKEKTVYLIDLYPNMPDNMSSVYSENCELLCGLGGIDGNLNDCINWNEAKFIETVWKDPR